MVVPFVAGAVVGSGVVYWFLRRARRATAQADEDRLVMQQEKQIVVDFMHDMVEALGENLSRVDLFQRIVHAAILSTGALSACVFERTTRGTMRGAATSLLESAMFFAPSSDHSAKALEMPRSGVK